MNAFPLLSELSTTNWWIETVCHMTPTDLWHRVHLGKCMQLLDECNILSIFNSREVWNVRYVNLHLLCMNRTKSLIWLQRCLQHSIPAVSRDSYEWLQLTAIVITAIVFLLLYERSLSFICLVVQAVYFCSIVTTCAKFGFVCSLVFPEQPTVSHWAEKSEQKLQMKYYTISTNYLSVFVHWLNTLSWSQYIWQTCGKATWMQCAHYGLRPVLLNAWKLLRSCWSNGSAVCGWQYSESNFPKMWSLHFQIGPILTTASDIIHSYS